jgi:RNA polymerase sigma factor (sigma-70 family)
MKIAAELRIKHGVLYEACQQYGGIKPFAAKVGIGHQTLFKWLHLKGCPVPGVFNQWYTPKVEKRLEELTGVKATELFPQQLKEFTDLSRPTKFVAVKDIEVQALEWMASDLSARLTTSDPASDAITSEIRAKVRDAVGTLTERQQLIIDARFNRGLTYEETGREMRVTKERVRQLEAKAIRRLQESDALAGLVD